ncbi:MFS transporter [Acetobacter oeni]|uniref:MFS transporter n=1 Tax=Acetobacter oeni TaxID=304077 RepID=A0A511XGC4_9PROT|nr:MFS transporter [Acetobacter oeni]MBB3882078.1 MFS family permease [Acetobacter oeni]NHO17843.1 MFS transporter [Acetobacter oeni]GBR09326.1 major facilitator superfamily transporter [Acetobacter oeni LMG 21952]GEN61996.1 MFS transporter [Acetobacter oeni]
MTVTTTRSHTADAREEPACSSDAEGSGRRNTVALDGLSFLLADVQDNLGAFLTALLAAYGWPASDIGTTIAAGGVGAVMARVIGGWALDKVSSRRALLAACCLMTAVPIAVAAVFPGFWQITCVHFLAGGAGALFSPLLAAISRETAGDDGYMARMGRNEAFNHSGNAVVACVMSVVGGTVGPVAPLWAITGLAAISLLFVGLMTRRADAPEVKPAVPDGRKGGRGGHPLTDRRLLIFLACYLMFNVANGATVPLLIERQAVFHFGSPSSMTALCIIVAQATMVPVACIVGRAARHWPRRLPVLLALALQPVRDLLIMWSAHWPAMCAAEVLDGLSSGVILVLFYAVLSDLSSGGGQRNLLIGTGLAVGTIGALLSNFGSGLIATRFGFNGAFLALAGSGVLAFMLFLFAMPETHVVPERMARPS